eukprot:3935866-Pyramimonas_sp.AAC.1
MMVRWEDGPPPLALRARCQVCGDLVRPRNTNDGNCEACEASWWSSLVRPMMVLTGGRGQGRTSTNNVRRAHPP